MDVDEIDVELRTPDVVRARVLILSALLRRLALEIASPGGNDETHHEAFDEREWLRAQGLASQLTTRETALLGSPVGSIESEAIAEISWQGEALVALAWAVGVLAMPPIDAISDVEHVTDLVPRPWDAIKAWMADPAIVAQSDAVRERERAEIWHWRLTTERLRRDASPADRGDIEEAISEVATEAHVVGLVYHLLDHDFPVCGRSIEGLSDTEIDELISGTTQRLRALNWLCGFGTSWDDVPLDV